MQTQRGVTLIEMMIVIAIIGVVSSVVMTAGGSKDGVTPRVMSDQLITTMSLARTRALMTKKIQRVELHFEESPPKIYVWQAALPGMAPFDPPSAQFVERVRVPKRVQLFSAVNGVQAVGASPTALATQYNIDFMPDGTSTPATIYLTDSRQYAKARVMVIRPTGSAYARQDW